MIKRSAILLLLFSFASLFLLLYASTHTLASTSSYQPAAGKCMGQCGKKKAPVPWNIATPAIFQPES